MSSLPPARTVDGVSPRCGNCHHGVRSESFAGSLVACSIRLEYRHMDQMDTCEHFRPASPESQG